MTPWPKIVEKDAKLIIAELYTMGRKELYRSKMNNSTAKRHAELSETYFAAARALEELHNNDVD
jgi:hypothetical protein